MNDTVLVALIAAGPPTLAAVASLLHARRVARHVGQTNGSGSIAEMTEQMLKSMGQARAEYEVEKAYVRHRLDQLAGWSQEHGDRDDEFEQYVHQRFHDVGNSLARLLGAESYREVMRELRGPRAQEQG